MAGLHRARINVTGWGDVVVTNTASGNSSINSDSVCFLPGEKLSIKMKASEGYQPTSIITSGATIMRELGPDNKGDMYAMIGNDRDIDLNVTFTAVPSRSIQIPEELAKELSELLIKQSIRENMLERCIDDPDKYDKMEAMLVPINARIGAIQTKITQEFIPDAFKSDDYMWNYNGWEIDGNTIHIEDAR